MQRTTALAIASVLGTLGGLAGAFFLAGPALFADGPTNERLVVVLILTLGEGILAFGLALGFPAGTTVIGWAIGVPITAVSAFFTVAEPQMVGVAGLIVAGTVASTVLGLHLAGRITRRRAAAAKGP